MTTLHIQPENINLHFAIWVLGILTAMKAKTLPLEAGIWTLPLPKHFEMIQAHCSPELCDIIQNLDELDALAELVNFDAVKKEIGDLMARLNVIIAEHSESYLINLTITE